MDDSKIILVGENQSSILNTTSEEEPVKANPVPKMERVDIPPGSRVPNAVMEKLLPKVGREIVVNNMVIMKVVYANFGKRRVTFEVVGLVTPVQDV